MQPFTDPGNEMDKKLLNLIRKTERNILDIELNKEISRPGMRIKVQKSSIDYQIPILSYKEAD